jgi:hypothetical protein
VGVRPNYGTGESGAGEYWDISRVYTNSAAAQGGVWGASSTQRALSLYVTVAVAQATTSLIFPLRSIAMLLWDEGDSLWGYVIRNIASACRGRAHEQQLPGRASWVLRGQKYMALAAWGRRWAGSGLAKGAVQNDG